MMKWQAFHIDLPEARFALLEAGDGPNVLICFHGYEQSKALFVPLFEKIPMGWRIVLVDLPLYGETLWHDYEQGISDQLLRAFWAACGERYPEAKRHLFGFSMGGKFALSLQSSVRRGAESLILMAPDGIKSNFWHRVILSPGGLSLNRWLDAHPNWILKPAKWLYLLKLLDPLSYRVVRLSYETASARERKSRQLMIYRALKVDYPRLSAQNDTKWHLIWGKKDKILRVGLSQKFQKLLPQVKLHILEGGHMLIHEKRIEVADLLRQIMHSLSTESVDK
ncbi:MAG: alpha/beta hydrolase [Bacteroidota bacterium]